MTTTQEGATTEEDEGEAQEREPVALALEILRPRFGAPPSLRARLVRLAVEAASQE